MIFHFAIYLCDSLGRVEPALTKERRIIITILTSNKSQWMQLYVSNVCRNWETLKLIKLNHNNSNQIKCGFLVREEYRKIRRKPLRAEKRSFKLFIYMEMFVI